MRTLPIVVLASLLVACSTPARRSEADVCRELGWIFYVVAEYRAQGRTRAEQLAWVQRTFERERTREVARRIVRHVHARDDRPIDVGWDVSDHCTVDRDGAAVVSLEASPAARP